MPAPEPLTATRIVASPAALDAATWPDGVPVLRIAPDEVLVAGAVSAVVDDPFALIEDEDGFVAVALTRPGLDEWMGREAEWRPPDSASFFAQGMVAGLPIKLWADGEQVLVVTRSSFGAELEVRL